MNTITYNVYLTITGASTSNPGSKVLTLNQLTNGYYSPPCNGNGNPPVVAQYVDFADATNFPLVQIAGLSGTANPDILYQFGGTFGYNLPDGSLLTFGFQMDPYGTVSLVPSIPTTSSGSLYAVSYGSDYSTNLYLTLYQNS